MKIKAAILLVNLQQLALLSRLSSLIIFTKASVFAICQMCFSAKAQKTFVILQNGFFLSVWHMFGVFFHIRVMNFCVGGERLGEGHTLEQTYQNLSFL